LKLTLLISSALLSVSCAGWVPFVWADYGDRTGFTESQWANAEANVGDLERWSVGVGFAYGGWLPGLMQEQAIILPPIPAPKPPAPAPVDAEGAATAIGRWPWYTALSLFLAIGLVAWLVYRKRKKL
jgi:hypothetical protein